MIVGKRAVMFFILLCSVLETMGEIRTYYFYNMFSISVSDKLELREDDDAYTLFLRDTLNGVSNSSAIVFQQKGLSERNESSYKKYCRIIITADCDESCSYPYPNEDNFSQEDIETLVSACNDELGPGQSFKIQPSATISTTPNGYKYIRIYYVRSGYSNNGDVKVNICYFFNCKYCVKAIFSYRISEADIWRVDIDRSIASFSWMDSQADENDGIDDMDESGQDNFSQILLGIAVLLLSGMVFLFMKSK